MRVTEDEYNAILRRQGEEEVRADERRLLELESELEHARALIAEHDKGIVDAREGKKWATPVSGKVRKPRAAPPPKDGPTEHQLQAKVIRWVRENESKFPALQMLFAVPNGGHRHVSVAVQLKAEGVKRGVPDLLLPFPCGGKQGLAIECKVGKNKPTPEQIWWMERLEEVGWRTAVCYTSDEAVTALRMYLAMD